MSVKGSLSEQARQQYMRAYTIANFRKPGLGCVLERIAQSILTTD
jgi:hypothetical protein